MLGFWRSILTLSQATNSGSVRQMGISRDFFGLSAKLLLSEPPIPAKCPRSWAPYMMRGSVGSQRREGLFRQ